MEIGSFLKKSHFWHGAMTITVRADEGEALWKEAQIDLLERLQVPMAWMHHGGDPEIGGGVTKYQAYLWV